MTANPIKTFLFHSILFLSTLGNGVGQTPDFARVPGAIVAHSPASSGLYIGSPSLCVLPNGDYLASHDLFGPQSNEFVKPNSRIYRSTDKGKTWTQIAEINGQFWSKLYVHRNGLYFFGTDKHHGNTIIRQSTDNGVTWTNPTDGENGLLLAGEYHCAPVPFLEHNGRLWRAMEDAMGPIKQWGKRYGAFMLSMPLDADPMKAASWTSTNVLRYDSTYLNNGFGGWIEGNAVLSPDGEVLDILRVDHKKSLDEKAAFVRISPDGKTASFDVNTGFVPFPGGSKKFTIRYDPKSKLYWTLTNYIPQEFKQANAGKNPASLRNTQALCSSSDLKTWSLRQIVLQHPDVVKHGFQYVYWLFDGNDIILLSRTAYDDGLGGAHNNHDANFLTFHRIKKFRKKPVSGL
ncbi:sialidase family protein [Larkinella terrae]|uniref:sialidase family protein n=1 Tax=Larkinella terrae TaxID=2025311 RepID=UPI001980337D|nr:sialidase family protein [Larkinella terrae]